MIAHCRIGCAWKQSGNRTGHCSGCHRTFDSLAAFERHQAVENGRVTCHDPGQMIHGGDRVGEPVYESRTADLTEGDRALAVQYWRLKPSAQELEHWAQVRTRWNAPSGEGGDAA